MIFLPWAHERLALRRALFTAALDTWLRGAHH